MATTKSDPENEIKSWLNAVFKGEILKVDILGNTEKGDGYMGDVIFVSAENKSKTKYDLVLKCSKKSQALRDNAPVKEIFLNEIFMLETVLPYFTQFQKEKGVKSPFDNAPKCHGSFTGENMEVIVLENLKTNGYDLWPKREPLSRKHIDLVVTQYGKFHATSLALQNQRPAEFQKILDTIQGAFKGVEMKDTLKTLYSRPVDESCELLKDDMDKKVLQKWKKLKDQVDYLFEKRFEDLPGFKVISHGDCWNNNFMYLHQKGEEKIPLKVTFLDWQAAKYSSPVMDLSYFLFCCISKEDLEDLDDILIKYHESFINQLRELGEKDQHVLYPFKEFLNDWKRYCTYGILSATLVIKVISMEKDEIMDIGDVAESGKSFTEAFRNEVRDKENYKRRIRPIVEYVVKHDLV